MFCFLEVAYSCNLIIDLFRYESEFFKSVVNGREIVSWAAVDRSRPNVQSDELVGFVTARIVLAKESEVSPLLILLHCICFCTLYQKGLMRMLYFQMYLTDVVPSTRFFKLTDISLGV